ncbi:zinc finger protein 579-like [Rhineura floridana]|uniref:zinc finger protein 579-like n=1 Tax=Rhineura floridana TaxID=261503 RepID=UPI002AC88CB3|nr:zinc finger protein 579-like [Rhineura floridana]
MTSPDAGARSEKQMLLQADWTLLCLACNETKSKLKAHKQHSHTPAVGGDCPPLPQADSREAAFPLLSSSSTPIPKKAHGCSVCSKHDLETQFLIHIRALPFHCGKWFRRLSHLKQHDMSHAITRPFQCVICQEEFKHLTNLACHQQGHKGDKSHQCSICHKFFSCSYNLLRH